jgi:hypothetical protein
VPVEEPSTASIGDIAAALRSDGTDRDSVSTAEVREALNAIYN